MRAPRTCGVLASVMGEDSLPEVDRRFLAFGRDFEQRLVNQEGRRTLEESMAHRLAAAARPAGRGAHAPDEAADRSLLGR